MKSSFNYIDIFAGCGGISLGLHNANWKGLFAIEKDSLAFETLKFNLIDKTKHFKWVPWLEKSNHDINELIDEKSDQLRSLRGNVTLLVGGPPCQGFSMAGRRNESDTRNLLLRLYLTFVELVQPQVIVFENVKGFTIGFKTKNNSRGIAYSEIVTNKLKEFGYDVDWKIINFSDFGVPQRRERCIIIGTKKGKAQDIFENIYQYKKEFLKQKGLPITRKTTVKDAIGDLFQSNGLINSPDNPRFKAGLYGKKNSSYQSLMKKGLSRSSNPDSHRFPNHSTETIKRFRYILSKANRNTNVSDELKKKFNLKKHCIIPLDSNGTSPTLTTLPDDYIHYEEPRILTVREYARIQSFPDTFEFKGKYTTGGKNRKLEVPRYTQIGNAIPPLFGEILGIVLKEYLKRSSPSSIKGEVTNITQSNNTELNCNCCSKASLNG